MQFHYLARFKYVEARRAYPAHTLDLTGTVLAGPVGIGTGYIKNRNADNPRWGENRKMWPPHNRKAQMEYLKQKGPESGQSAYDQIKDFLLKLFKERPPQRRVYSEFEELTQQLGDIKLPVGTRMATELEDLRECFSQLQFNPRKELNPEEGEGDEGEAEENPDEAEGEPEEAEAPELIDVNTQNLPEIARILQTKGFGFTQLDAFRLQKAINDMAKQYEIGEDEIKLFGRVGPYWVLRTTAALPEAEEEEAEAENAEEEEADADGGENPGEEAPEDEDDELRALKA